MNIDLFADSIDRQTPVGRLNAGVKLLATLAITIALILVKDWVSAASILALELLALKLMGIHPLRLLGRFWPVLIGALLSGWSTALLVEKTGRTVFELGFILVTTDSLATGFALMLRGLAMVLPGLLLIATTDPTDIADSLAQTLRLPARFVLAALAALRLVSLMFTEWNTLGQARRARGLGGSANPVQAISAAMGQVFALLVQAIRRATRLSVTMEARGFGGTTRRSWARAVRYSAGDAWFALGCIALVAAGYGIAWWAGELSFLWQ